MKEKQKRRPYRHFYPFIILLLMFVGGYFTFPFAQNAFTNWWADDPLTPICDVPHLELVYAFNESDALTERLYHWHQGIEPERFGDFYGEFSSLRWSPDFETLYISSRSLGQDYHLLLHANNDLEILPTEFQAWFWSPDGVYAAAISQNGNSEQLRIYDEQAGESHSMRSDNIIAEGLRIANISWSPNSQRIAVMIDQTLHVFELSSGHWVEIFSLNRADNTAPIWSPNSDLLAQGWVFVDVFDVKSHEKLWTIEATNAWDWGEKGILVHTSRNDTFLSPGEPSYDDVFVANFETRIVEWLADSNHTSITGWSQSEEAFLFSPETIEYSSLHFMDDGHAIGFHHNITPQFTPDGRYVNYQGDNGWLYLFDMENRKPCRLYKAELGAFYLYTWRIIPQS